MNPQEVRICHISHKEHRDYIFYRTEVLSVFYVHFVAKNIFYNSVHSVP